MFHANGAWRQVGVANFVLSSTPTATLFVKETVHQDDTILVKIYALKIGIPNFIKQTLLTKKVGIISNTIMMGNGSTQYSTIDRLSIQKINRNIYVKLHQTSNRLSANLVLSEMKRGLLKQAPVKSRGLLRIT